MSGFWWAVVTAAIWGVVPLLEKLGLRHAPPAVGVAARSLGVVAGLLMFSVVRPPWASLAAIGWPSVLLLALGGLLASFIGQLAFYHALKDGALSQVTPVAGAYPLVAALLGWSILREPLTTTRLLGVVLIVVGTLLLRR